MYSYLGNTTLGCPGRFAPVRFHGLFAAALLLLLSGCASVQVQEQRLVSKPNMQFSRSAVYNYSSKILPQIQPGLATSGGAAASTCTICK